jgi:hypothetical protein
MITTLRKRGRTYHLEYRFGDMSCKESCSLKTSDKQVAQKRMQEKLQELQREQAGLLSPRVIREAAKVGLADHLAEYLQHLQAGRRSAVHVRRVFQRLAILRRDCGWEYLKF